MTKRLRLLLPVALIITPLMMETCYIHRFAVDVPFWDQWTLVPLLMRLSGGDVGGQLQILWSQHNEHRVVFPKLVFFVLARMSGWDVTVEMYFSLFLSLVSLVVLGLIYRRTVGGSLWGLVPIAWLVFSLGQWENILWGWQLVIFIQVLGIVLGLYLLSIGSPLSTLMAILCGVVASFSFNTGLLIWPVGVALLAMLRADRRQVVPWVLAGLLVFVAYFIGYEAPPHHPPLTSGLYSPLATVRFFLMNVGAALGGGDVNLSMAMGLSLAILLILLILTKVQTKPRIRLHLLPSDAVAGSLVLVSLLSSAAIAVARVGFGSLLLALNSRYTTVTALGVIGIYMLLIKEREPKESRPSGRLSLTGFQLYPALLSLLLVGLVMANTHGIAMGRQVHASRLELKQALQTYEDQPDEVLQALFIPSIVREQAKFLQARGLSVFRETVDLDPATHPTSIEQPVPD